MSERVSSRRAAVLFSCVALHAAGAPVAPQALPVAQPNDNRVSAGSLRDGVLQVSLEAVRAMWHPDGDSLPGLAVEAFAEAGQAPLAPGPLLRIPQGTTIRVRVRKPDVVLEPPVDHAAVIVERTRT